MKRLVILVSVIFALVLSGCSQPVSKTATGAATGTALGAGLGAIVGSQTGKAGPGIAIGAAAGAITGALLGNVLEKSDQQNREVQAQLEQQRKEIEENRRLMEELRRRGVDVETTDRGVVAYLPDILFAFDSHQLSGDARSTIHEVSEVIKSTNRHVAVEGHTDSVGSDEYNERLSRRRAESVADELVANRIPGSQISVRGYGKSRPIATNDTTAGRARNRRVEVIIEN